MDNLLRSVNWRPTVATRHQALQLDPPLQSPVVKPKGVCDAMEDMIHCPNERPRTTIRPEVAATIRLIPRPGREDSADAESRSGQAGEGVPEGTQEAPEARPQTPTMKV
jgi:hypothetical protein